MHMIIGLFLTSLLRKKKRIGTQLPSIQGKLETVHALPGRLRFNSPLLIGLQNKTYQKISTEIEKIDGIEKIEINAHTGSLLVIYQVATMDPLLVHGIVIKVLGLEGELNKSPTGTLTKEFDLISKSLNQQIHQSSYGLLDLKSSLMFSIFLLALYQIIVQKDRALPGGINLLWWTYVLMQKGRSA